MQHESTRSLRQNTSRKRHDRPSRRTRCRDESNRAHLQVPRQQSREDRRDDGVDRAQQESHDGDRHRATDHVRDLPREDLEDEGAEREACGEALLAQARGEVRQCEAAERDAGPEAGGHVADFGWVAALVDQVGDDPAGFADFGALVGEDEEGADEGRAVGDGAAEEVEFAWFCCAVAGGCFLQAVGVAVDALLLVAPEGPAGEEEADDAQADCDEEEAGPQDAVGDHCGRHDGCYGSANAVCAVSES